MDNGTLAKILRIQDGKLYSKLDWPYLRVVLLLKGYCTPEQ